MNAPLKVITDYSLLKSLIKIPDLMEFLKARQITCCGICDENLFGVMDFYTHCLKNGIKPLIGLSLILDGYEIDLYAKNYNGYKNLLKLHTLKHKNILSINDLQTYAQDIVLVIPYDSLDFQKELTFFEDIYYGYRNIEEKNNLKEDKKIYFQEVRALNKDDLKYMEYLDILRKEEKGNYYKCYYDESFKDEKIEEFTDLCNIEIPFNNRYIPKYNKDIFSWDFLNNLAHKGLYRRLNNQRNPVYEKRLEYELSVIKNMNFVDYFLIVYDYVLFAKNNHILVGPGRGSAAGSLVSYSLGITDIDPLKYNLLFERFLNPARVTMPDIDIDFDAMKREQVINYVKEKYGEEKVALGITFSTLKSKLVLREIGKILKIDSNLLEKFLKEIDGNKNLKSNLLNTNINNYLKNYEELRKLYQVSLKLEGIKKNMSTHAAGVVISSVDLDTVIPVYPEEKFLLTGVTMEFLEDLGLLKMDFLGLKNLTTIANIKKAINNEDVLKDINLNDELVYQLFKTGKTEGIFQFETPAMRNLVLKMQPRCFKDLINAVALGRPGPKDHVDSFIRRMNNEETVSYLNETLEDILKETYGIILYQEQIIAILGKVAGYSYQEADVIRRAISKKKESVLQEEQTKFVLRAVNNHYEEKEALKIYAEISKFASYGFNKSHSVAYALIAYQMAYLKTYYAAQFIVELLNEAGNNKSNYYLTYLKQSNIIFKYPSVNNDSLYYVIKDKKLIMPLTIIKGITLEMAKKIMMAKEAGYVSFLDFVCKTKDFITPEVLTNLIYGGAFQEFNYNYQTLINNIDSALNYASLAEFGSSLIMAPEMQIYPEYDLALVRQKEYEVLGFYLSNHPASKYQEGIMKLNNSSNYLFKRVVTVCLIETIKTLKTKKGDDMAFFSGSDETGVLDFTVFPNTYPLFKNLKSHDLVKVKGEVVRRLAKIQIVVSDIVKLEE